MTSLITKKPRKSCSSNEAGVGTSSKNPDGVKISDLLALVKEYSFCPEAMIHPASGRVVALQRDAARAWGVADASINKLVNEDKIRRYSFKFLDLEDVSLALSGRRAVGRPRKEAQ